MIALNRAKLLSIEIFSAQITVSSEQGIVHQDWTAAVSCVWVVAAGMSFMDRLLVFYGEIFDIFRTVC